MFFRSHRAIALAAGLALATAVGPAVAQDEDPETRVIATVDGEEIYLAEALQAIRALPPQVQQMPLEMILPVLAEQLAIGRVIQQRALDEGLQDDPEVQERLARAEADIMQDVWMDRQVDARISDEALNEAYTRFVEDNPPVEEVSARHILVETEEDARGLIAELNDGADFAELAAEHSVGPSGAQGGDLGYFQERQMVAPFGEVAFSLQPGEFTQEPVETEFGWHVILSEDRRMVEPPSLEEVEDQLRSSLGQEVVQEILTEVGDSADIAVIGPDGELAPR